MHFCYMFAFARETEMNMLAAGQLNRSGWVVRSSINTQHSLSTFVLSGPFIVADGFGAEAE